MKKLIFALSAGLCFATTLSAQHNHTRGVCGTSEMYRIGLQTHPQATEAEKRFNRFVETYKQNIQHSSEKTSGYEGSKYIIPTVVHVVHSGYGKPDSISKEQILSMFPHLFEDLRNVPGTRGFGTGVDTHIEFQLATRDPKGNPTDGITYTKDADATDVVIDSDSAGIKPGFGNIKLKSLIRWDSTRYCNMWIVKSIRTIDTPPGRGNIAGYAQYPWYPSPPTDGIVVAHPFFGTTGTSRGYSNTTTHEIGHWLALIHPFDSSGVDGCDPGDCLKWGDKVCDVPPTSPGFKNISQRRNSCNTDSPDMPDISRNYMDYAMQDSAANHYSAGQAVRSVAALVNPEFDRKNKLWSEENNQRTGVGKWGAPKAYFWANNRYTCVGQPVTFLDYSANKPTSYEWKFEGGEPATSTEAYPVVKYNKAGKYRVELKVSNLSGKSDEIAEVDFITVTDEKVKLPFRENFSGNDFPPAGWYIDNPDFAKLDNQGLTWQKSALGSGDTSLGCAVMPFFYYNDYKQRDGLQLPTFDLSANREAGLTFNLSYHPIRYYSESAGAISEEFLYTDTLEVQVSLDCGANWWTVARDGGERLMTASEPIRTTNQNSVTHLTPAPWKKFSVNLNPYAGLSNVQLRFTGINGWGNHMYLDDIAILPQTVATTTGRIEAYHAHQLRLEPNPATDQTSLVLLNPVQGSIRVEVLDLTGKVLWQESVQTSGSELRHPLDLSRFSEGVYIVRVSDGENIRTEKIIKQ
jgi:hypothetical protein